MSRVFFTDRNLGKHFPRILREAGLTVERHDDHFTERTQDEEWLAEVGRKGWIAITHDKQIRYKANEREAVMLHKVALLVVIGDLPFPRIADSFVATIRPIERFLTKHSPPFIAKVYRGASESGAKGSRSAGRVEKWYP